MGEDTDPRKRSVLQSISGTSPGRANTTAERRGFLKKATGFVGGSIAALFGFSSHAMAMSSKEEQIAREAAKEYTSSEAVQNTVELYASGLLRDLAEKEQFDRNAVSALPTETIHESIRSYVDADEGVLVHATAVDGEPNVKIQIKRPLPDGRQLVLVVNPETEKSQAFFKRSSETRTENERIGRSEHFETYYTAKSAEGDDVTIQNCDRVCSGEPDERCGYSCTAGSCGCVKYEVRTSCTDPDCIGCTLVDYSCCGDYKCS